MGHPPSATSQEKCPLEKLLSIRRLGTGDGVYHPDTFTNQHPLKCPPWARGAFGGHILGLALLAAYETVKPDYTVHIMHCTFLHAANVDLTICCSVQRVRDSKSFASRVIEAKQRGKLIFTASASFMLKKGNTKKNMLRHTTPFAGQEDGKGLPLLSVPPQNPDTSPLTQSPSGQGGFDQICDCIRAPVRQHHLTPEEKNFHQWIKARGKITDSQPQQLAALAYMTDIYCIGTVFRAHGASRFSNRGDTHPMLRNPSGPNSTAEKIRENRDYFQALVAEEHVDNGDDSSQREKRVDWLVTLDHTIYFHDVEGIRADEWMLAEMETPWAGDERGLVIERVWSHGGTLLATCIQQGAIRLLPGPRDEKL